MQELPTVTFLFTDIGGSTQLPEQRPEAMKIVIGLAPED
jgi:class 3 adenylate cyclase